MSESGYTTAQQVLFCLLLCRQRLHSVSLQRQRHINLIEALKPRIMHRLAWFLRPVFVNMSLVGSFSAQGSAGGRFCNCWDVCVTDKGLVIVGDQFNHRVVLLELSKDGRTLAYRSSFGGRGQAEGNFSYPLGVAVTRAGEVLVADEDNGRVSVLQISPTRSLRYKHSTREGVLESPCGVAVTAMGTVLVTEQKRNSVVILKLDGHALRVVSELKSFAGDDCFDYPQGIALTSTGTVLVADQHNKRIVVLRLKADGQTLHYIHSYRLYDWTHTGSSPQSVAVTGSTALVTTDSGSILTLRFKADGHTLCYVRSFTLRSRTTTFGSLMGLAVAPKNRIVLVTDYSMGCILLLRDFNSEYSKRKMIKEQAASIVIHRFFQRILVDNK